MSIRPLPQKLQTKAILELNEVPEPIQEDLNHIKEWLSKQRHLKCRTDDQWLLNFLRSCKFSLQRTKEKLDLYYTMRTLAPEFFKDRDPFLPEIQECLKEGLLVILPTHKDSAGPVIGILRAPADPDKISFITAVKVTLMILDILIWENDHFSVAGQHVLQDLKGTTYKHFVQMTPSILKKGAMCLQNAYPTRAKGFHFINTPSIFESTHNILKMFVSKKLLDRMYFHNDDMRTIYATIPLSILPKEYGGVGASMAELTAEWKQKVESYRDWFLGDAKYFSDETKRLGKPKTSADILDVEGSFRRLEID